MRESLNGQSMDGVIKTSYFGHAVLYLRYIFLGFFMVLLIFFLCELTDNKPRERNRLLYVFLVFFMFLIFFVSTEFYNIFLFYFVF